MQINPSQLPPLLLATSTPPPHHLCLTLHPILNRNLSLALDQDKDEDEAETFSSYASRPRVCVREGMLTLQNMTNTNLSEKRWACAKQVCLGSKQTCLLCRVGHVPIDSRRYHARNPRLIATLRQSPDRWIQDICLACCTGARVVGRDGGGELGPFRA